MKDFTNSEAVEMMNACLTEIRLLRSQVERLQPKAEAYDNIAAILRALIPEPSGTFSQDVTWQLERRIKELVEVEKRREAEIDVAPRRTQHD